MKRPLFLARRSYRQRRLRDAARLLPILAGFLIILPMLWGDAESDLRRTATDAIYLFAVWLFLIIAAVLVARNLTDEAETGTKLPLDAEEKR